MPAPRPTSSAQLPRLGALFGALTGLLGGGMIWTTADAPALPTALTIASGIVVLAAVGWFGTERVMDLASSLEEVSE